MSSFNRTAERARNTFIVGLGIPPTAVGGWLKPSLHKRKFFSNPPNGSSGMVKVRPSGCGRRLLTKSGRLNLNHPRTAVGGIREREKAADVGRTLTIPQLPLGGLRNNPQNGQSRVRVFRVLFCLTIFTLLCASCRQDMQDQPKYKPLAPSSFFSDRKSSRQLVEGTAPYSPEGKATPPMADLSKMTTLPFALTPQVMDRGQERFNIYCSPCHGRLGYGNGMVVQRGFRAPPSYHSDRLRQAPVGHFYDVMTNGFGAMPSYADKVAPDDRWAVAAYIRALQLSQHATINDAPPEERAKLQSGGQKQ